MHYYFLLGHTQQKDLNHAVLDQATVERQLGVVLQHSFHLGVDLRHSTRLDTDLRQSTRLGVDLRHSPLRDTDLRHGSLRDLIFNIVIGLNL